jgi:hypothetical protein
MSFRFTVSAPGGNSASPKNMMEAPVLGSNRKTSTNNLDILSPGPGGLWKAPFSAKMWKLVSTPAPSALKKLASAPWLLNRKLSPAEAEVDSHKAVNTKPTTSSGNGAKSHRRFMVEPPFARSTPGSRAYVNALEL